MRKFCLLMTVVAALSLCACNATKKSLGLNRQGPDESTVKTNEPLTLPPEYNVRPKKNELVKQEAEEIFDE
jgi:hypothetical protein